MRLAASLAALLALTPVPLFAQEWFTHRFGELRAYHGDWLAVCSENGAGACRIVAIWSILTPSLMFMKDSLP